MNTTKTVNVSIAGIAFMLDAEAYGLLRDYLDRIGQGYRHDADGAEIIADIEARICELILNEQSADEPVPAGRIRAIIARMGLPDEIASEASDKEAPEASATPEASAEKLARRLYRDPDGAKMGGVCSGLAVYFNVEPVIVRLCFLAPLLLEPLLGVLRLRKLAGFNGTLVGVFFMLYFLLWFAIPKAKTPRQKLEMRGEPVTADSILRNFRDDFNDLAESPRNAKSASVWADIVYTLGRIVLFFVKFVAGCVAFGFSVATFAVGVTLFALLFNVDGINISDYDWIGWTGWLPGGKPVTILFLFVAMMLFGSIATTLWLFIFTRPAKRGKGLGVTFLVILAMLILIPFTSLFSSMKRLPRWDDIAAELKAETSIEIRAIAGRDTTRVETIRVGGKTVADTIRIEYFQYSNK